MTTSEERAILELVLMSTESRLPPHVLVYEKSMVCHKCWCPSCKKTSEHLAPANFKLIGCVSCRVPERTLSVQQLSVYERMSVRQKLISANSL